MIKLTEERADSPFVHPRSMVAGGCLNIFTQEGERERGVWVGEKGGEREKGAGFAGFGARS